MFLDTLTKLDYVALTLGSVFLFTAFYRRLPGRQLEHIPSVGSSSLLFSFIGAFKFLDDSATSVRKGCEKYGHSIFRVPTLDRWIVIVHGPKFIEDLRKAPEEVLSFQDAINEQLRITYTLGDRITDNPYHVPIVRSQLTRSLAAIFPSLQEEVAVAFEDIIPADKEWKKYRALETMMPIICRASNRIFVGYPLSRDPDFMDMNVQFTITVMKAANTLNLLLPFLRPMVAYFLTSVPATVDRAAEHLRPIVEERQRKIDEYGKDYPDKPTDMLSWLMDEAEGDETSLRNLALRILTINFAAIHTSAMTFTHALFYLAEHPEYVKPMRDEIEEIIDREGWTHSGMGRMVKLDSFIKESQRLNPLSSITTSIHPGMMGRIARTPFTFSDGTYIPAGTTLLVAMQAAHLDDTNYDDPTVFDPFRFVDKTKKVNVSRKVDMASTHADFLAFGHGRHACPGRFFAANELKLMLAHILMTYDVKLEGEHPKNMWLVTACIPNTKGEVLFRKRVD
ncbi:Ent-kaurene oxidase [Hypsizygus marmoreus]|uniref:Ent-kaurene oxidase n=1 Tax=Hypsizygus marmoreus TaxID=39966 RepID=A0A369K9W4_HYPMA|nr:Ent-kaurene oxidase [Hypsizygus marmoreus]